MQLWLNRTGEVSLREQMITQIVLAILCRELAPGERLPSTRELARRFQIHANTTSRAYRQLERDGWLEFRHGSGVFVRESRAGATGAGEPASGRHASGRTALEHQIDELLADLLRKAGQLGAPPALVRERVGRWLAAEPPSRWLLIEPDPELRQILVFEMQQALRMPVSACPPDDFLAQEAVARAVPVARPSKAEAVRKRLPAQCELTVLDIRPIPPAMHKYLPKAGEGLLGIASRWPDFLRIARTMLVASGVAEEALVIRDAARAGWKRGLDQCFAIVCDAAIEHQLPEVRHRVAFRLLDESSLARLRQVEASLGEPAAEEPQATA